MVPYILFFPKAFFEIEFGEISKKTSYRNRRSWFVHGGASSLNWISLTFFSPFFILPHRVSCLTSSNARYSCNTHTPPSVSAVILNQSLVRLRSSRLSVSYILHTHKLSYAYFFPDLFDSKSIGHIAYRYINFIGPLHTTRKSAAVHFCGLCKNNFLRRMQCSNFEHEIFSVGGVKGLRKEEAAVGSQIFLTCRKFLINKIEIQFLSNFDSLLTCYFNTSQ